MSDTRTAIKASWSAAQRLALADGRVPVTAASLAGAALEAAGGDAKRALEVLDRARLYLTTVSFEAGEEATRKTGS